MKNTWNFRSPLGHKILMVSMVLVIGIIGTYLLRFSSAATAPTGSCSGNSVGTRTYGSTSHAIYNCSFWETAHIYDVGTDKYTTHTFNAGTNWVMCQVKGSQLGSSSSAHNVWWAFTESNQSTWGWVNAYYAAGGTNDEQFSGAVPTSCPLAFGLAPGETPPAVSVKVTASPTSIAYNGSSTISWSSSNATSCSASGGWSGSKATSGSAKTAALKSTTAYGLSCKGLGSASGSSSATVSVAAPPAPVVSLSASPTSIAYNASSTLKWSSSNATACTGSGGSFAGSKTPNASGSVSTGALKSKTIYSLSCSGAGGTKAISVTVSVAAAPSSGGGGSGGTGSGTPPPHSPPPPPPGQTTTTPKPKTNVTSTAPSGYPSNAADGTVEAGTTSAVIAVSAGGASAVHVIYGTSADQLNGKTADQNTIGTILINVTGLTPKTTYTYKIVRSNSAGHSSTSAANTLITGGYTVMLQFVDSSGNGVNDLAGSINDSANSQAVSDSSGNMSFYELASGKYKVDYLYQDHSYSQSVDTSSDDNTGDPVGKIVTITFEINVDKLLTNPSQAATLVTSSTAKQHSSAAGAIVAVIISLMAIGVIAWFLIRRRRKLDSAYSSNYAPTAATSAPDIIDQHTLKHFQDHPPPPPTEHMTESLREMVIKSMHEQAVKKKQGPPPPP